MSLSLSVSVSLSLSLCYFFRFRFFLPFSAPLVAGLARLAGLLVVVLFANDIDPYLQEEAAAVLDEQEMKILNLTEQLAECKEQYLADLNDTIDDLNARQDDLLDSITHLANLTDSRKCEYFKLKG